MGEKSEIIKVWGGGSEVWHNVNCCVFILTHSVEETTTVAAEEEEEEEEGVLVVEEQETSVKKKKKKDKKKHIKEEPLSEEEPCTSTAIPVCLFLIANILLVWTGSLYFILFSLSEMSKQLRFSMMK